MKIPSTRILHSSNMICMLKLIILLTLLSSTFTQKTSTDELAEELEGATADREKECRFEMDDGQHLSLYHLRKKRAPDYVFKHSKETGLYTYHFNFCSPTIMTWNGHEDALGIQKIDGDCVATLARGGYSSISYLDPGKPNKGVKLVYDGGDACELGNRRVEHILKWDDNIHHEIESVEETETCTYTVTARTKYTCKLAATRQDLSSWEDNWTTPDSVTERRGWSLWNSGIVKLIFCIALVFVVVNVYLFYKNQGRDPFRNYSSVQPIKEKFRSFIRLLKGSSGGSTN